MGVYCFSNKSDDENSLNQFNDCNFFEIASPEKYVLYLLKNKSHGDLLTLSINKRQLITDIISYILGICKLI